MLRLRHEVLVSKAEVLLLRPKASKGEGTKSSNIPVKNDNDALAPTRNSFDKTGDARVDVSITSDDLPHTPIPSPSNQSNAAEFAVDITQPVQSKGSNTLDDQVLVDQLKHQQPTPKQQLQQVQTKTKIPIRMQSKPNAENTVTVEAKQPEYVATASITSVRQTVKTSILKPPISKSLSVSYEAPIIDTQSATFAFRTPTAAASYAQRRNKAVSLFSNGNYEFYLN